MAPLRAEDLDPDPLVQFDRWYQEAGSDEMALATASPDGRPSARMVLLKGYDAAGFVFFTDYSSDKGRQLAANPQAALLFRWLPLRQVRVEGRVEQVARSQTERYWATRPRGSQLAAAASAQSRPLSDRAVLEKRVADLRRRHGGSPVPVPSDWGGFRVVPDRVEFWQQGADRLHDRFRYRWSAQGWTRERLWP